MDGLGATGGSGRGLEAAHRVPNALAPSDRSRAAALVREGTPPNSRRAREGDERYWDQWCEARGYDPAPPVSVDTVVAFVTDHVDGLPPDVEAFLRDRGRRFGGRPSGAPHAMATVRRRLCTVKAMHAERDLDSPTDRPAFRKFLARAARSVAARGDATSKSDALTMDLLERVLAVVPPDGDLWQMRDRALLLVGFASGGRRRSEIARLHTRSLRAGVDDLGNPAFTWTLGPTKTDGEGRAGLVVPVVGRAHAALTGWMDAAGVGSGWVFRGIGPDGRLSDGPVGATTVWDVVKRRCAQAGLDASRLTPHSIRSGFMTEGERRGVSIEARMAMSGHADLRTAMGYVRAERALRSPAARLAEPPSVEGAPSSG